MDIPDFLKVLTNLKELTLLDCNILTLYTNILELKNLEQLFLNQNNLIILPNEMGELKENKLNELSKTLDKFVNLTFLNIEYNKLTKIPEAIG